MIRNEMRDCLEIIITFDIYIHIPYSICSKNLYSRRFKRKIRIFIIIVHLYCPFLLKH